MNKVCMYKQVVSSVVFCGILVVNQVYAQQAQQAPVMLTDTQSMSYDFDLHGMVEIESKHGNVAVMATDEPMVKVDMIKMASTPQELQALQPSVQVKDKDTYARIQAKGGKHLANASVAFVVHIPRFAELKIKTEAGAIAVEGVKGQMKLVTESGLVQILDARKEVEVRSASGDVAIACAANSFGKIDVKTKSGRVAVEQCGGNVEVETVSGDIAVAPRVVLNKADIELESDAGAIALQLPKNVQARVKAETKRGSITSGGLSWQRTGQYARKKAGKAAQAPVTGDKAELTLGKGFADIDLETKAGTITVRV